MVAVVVQNKKILKAQSIDIGLLKTDFQKQIFETNLKQINQQTESPKCSIRMH